MPPESAFRIPTSPVATLGTLTLLCAFVVNAYALVVSVAGQRRERPGLVRSGIYASWAFTALMCLASSLMVYAFLSHDFTIKYVAHYSDLSMPLFYKITAYWGGLDGSLMFWVWILSLFSAVALYVNRERHRDIIGYVVATIAAVSAFFLGLLLYHKNPFATFLTDPPTNGQGLNPLLQNYWMVVHPPSLYVGFVGMTIPFAFCIGALASGRLDDAWLHSVRVWVIVSWFFLSLGLTLGGIWAYEELGWGGYWAWDPVENAGFLPWLTATAFLHSVVIQERKGMLKVWNVVLMITTFFLTIFGTFMTRSGVVQSVHAFGEDNQLALLFILFMAAILVVSIGLVIYRLPALQSAASFESFISREFAFLLNNWILLTAAFFVLFATMFPTLSESIVGQRITVGPAFFNKWMTPIGLILLFLSGAAPLLAWRVTTRRKLKEQFLFPLATMAVAVGAIASIWPRSMARSAFMTDEIQLPVALVCFGLVFFTLATIAQEFWRGARVRRGQTGGTMLTSLVGVVISKRRKYGGYVVHAGIALMFFGFAGKAFTREKDVTLETTGEVFSLGDLSFRYDEFYIHDNDNHTQYTAQVTALKGNRPVATLYPAQRKYKHGSQEQTTEVAIDRNLDRDIYLVLNGFNPQTKLANFRVILNPLVDWVWIGFGILAFGTGICLLPERLFGAFRPRRRRGGGGGGAGAGGAAALALLVALGLGGARVAHAQDEAPGPAASKHVEVDAHDQFAQAPPVAIRLFENLVCLCGDCKRLTLKACTCAYAAKERANILGMLADKDLGTPDKEKKAYDEVVKAYIDRYGGQHVLAVPLDSAFNRLAWLVPYAVLAAALVLTFAVGRRWVARGRAPALASAGAAAAPKPGDEDLEEKLDDELRDVD